MNRFLIIGKNSELARDIFSRTAWHADHGSSPLTRQAVLYSGRTPDSAAGGTRSHSAEPHTPRRRAPSAHQPPVSGLGARFWRDMIVMFMAGCLTVAVLTLVLL
jgi:hypothetical protein